MKRDPKLVATTAVLAVGFAFSILIPKFFSSAPELSTCYHATGGSSSSLLQISEIKGEDVSGTLIFQNYEKDSSYGKFVGKYLDNQLKTLFTFQSEAAQSTREIIFTVDGNNLSADGFTYQSSDSCNSITFNQGLGLIPFDMKLPLHLFPQLKLQPMSQEQLGWTFGAGGLKPIQSAILVYTPLIGEPVDAVVFFLWKKSDWDVIANPNEPPDWGVMQWSDQSHVFSVTGPQDCVYPTEPDCGNISQIYTFIYEKDSYVNKVPKYSPAKVSVTNTKTFHDPETGYYVLSQFKIEAIKAEQSYRCDLTAFDKSGKEIISWKTEGLSFPPNPSATYSGQTNITPDQVPTVKSSTVKCEVADAI
jgi:hypothetical protein